MMHKCCPLNCFVCLYAEILFAAAGYEKTYVQVNNNWRLLPPGGDITFPLFQTSKFQFFLKWLSTGVFLCGGNALNGT